MAQSNLTSYLVTKIQELSAKPREAAEAGVVKVEEYIKTLLKLPIGDPQRLEISEQQPIQIESFISTLPNKQTSTEEVIRQQRLKETTQRKKELEEKLHYLKNQIELLEETTPSKQSKGAEIGLPIDEEERLAFIKRMKKHRKERDRKRQAQINKMQEELAQIQEEEQRQNEEIREANHRQMLDQLKKTEEELKRRAEKRKLLKNESELALKSVMQSKPRYIQIEERFEETVLLPQLEEKKQRLAELRRRFAPIKHEELSEHAKQHDDYVKSLSESAQQRAQQSRLDLADSQKQYYKGRLGERVEKEDRELKESLNKTEFERKRLIEKRLQYGNIVKEVHKPQIDSEKQAEIRQNQGRFLNPRMMNLSPPKSTTDPNSRKSYDVKDIGFRSESGNFKKNKFKPNPMVPAPKEKRSSVHIDFLGEQRKRRDQICNELEPMALEKLSLDEASLTDTPKGLEKLVVKADKQIERAKRQELTLSSAPVTMKCLAAQEAVDEAYLDSLKAKLAVLNSISL